MSSCVGEQTRGPGNFYARLLPCSVSANHEAAEDQLEFREVSAVAETVC